jgi:hypothetical protein
MGVAEFARAVPNTYCALNDLSPTIRKKNRGARKHTFFGQSFDRANGGSLRLFILEQDGHSCFKIKKPRLWQPYLLGGSAAAHGMLFSMDQAAA